MSKSLKEWYEEATKASNFAYNRYVQAFGDLSCPDHLRKSYGEIAEANWNFRDMISHIDTFGTIFAPEKCAACRNNTKHQIKMHNAYSRHKKLIDPTWSRV